MVKIGEILVEKGLISQQQLDAAIAVQGEQQLGQVLINWGWITQEQLMDALNIQTPPQPVQPQQSFLQQQQPVYQQPVVPLPSLNFQYATRPLPPVWLYLVPPLYTFIIKSESLSSL